MKLKSNIAVLMRMRYKFGRKGGFNRVSYRYCQPIDKTKPAPTLPKYLSVPHSSASRYIAILCLLTGAIFGNSPTMAETGYREIQVIAQRPNLARAVITARDLPPGFEESSPAEIAQLKKDLESEGTPYERFVVESAFHLKKHIKGAPAQFQEITGFTKLVPGFMSENYVRHNAESLRRGLIQEMENLPGQLGGINLGRLQPQPLTNLDGIGDVSAGVTTLLNISGFSARMDTVVFQRGRVVGKVMVTYLNSSRPGVSAADVARTLDSRILQLAR